MKIHRNIIIDGEFKDICNEILRENKSEEKWVNIESSDMFQTDHYCGGFDATERAFCFSYYDKNGREYWFQVSLEQIAKIKNGEIESLEVREAE